MLQELMQAYLVREGLSAADAARASAVNFKNGSYFMTINEAALTLSEVREEAGCRLVLYCALLPLDDEFDFRRLERLLDMISWHTGRMLPALSADGKVFCITASLELSGLETADFCSLMEAVSRICEEVTALLDEDERLPRPAKVNNDAREQASFKSAQASAARFKTWFAAAGVALKGEPWLQIFNFPHLMVKLRCHTEDGSAYLRSLVRADELPFADICTLLKLNLTAQGRYGIFPVCNYAWFCTPLQVPSAEVSQQEALLQAFRRHLEGVSACRALIAELKMMPAVKETGPADAAKPQPAPVVTAESYTLDAEGRLTVIKPPYARIAGCVKKLLKEPQVTVRPPRREQDNRRAEVLACNTEYAMKLSAGLAGDLQSCAEDTADCRLELLKQALNEQRAARSETGGTAVSADELRQVLLTAEEFLARSPRDSEA